MPRERLHEISTKIQDEKITLPFADVLVTLGKRSNGRRRASCHMRRESLTSPDLAQVRDRRGRMWVISVGSIDEQEDIGSWLRLSPEQRVELIGECVIDGLRVKGQSDVPRLRRIYSIVERIPSALPDRRRLRSRIPRST